MRLIGYTRVSTQDQADSGLGLAAQNEALDREAAHRGWTVVDRYSDTASGRSTRSRDGLTKALADIDGGKADGLIVSKLDRLSRSVLDFAELVCRAQADHWNLIVLDLGLDLDSPQGRFTAHVLCAAAQLERELISRRTKDALAAAKARGQRLGMPSKLPAEVAAQVRDLRAAGMTLAAVAAKLNDAGVATATGTGRWHPASVRAVLNRVTVDLPVAG